MVTCTLLRGGGAVSSHTLPFSLAADDYVTVNGTTVTSPYTFNSGDVIKIELYGTEGANYFVNGTTVSNGDTITLTDTDITITYSVSGGPAKSATITINT